MPRTKRPVKKQEKSTEDDDTLKKFNKLVADQKNRIESRTHMEIRNIEVAFKILMGSINSIHLKKTVGEMKTELHLKEVPNTRATRNSNRSASHDDGYLTENSSQGSGERGGKKKQTLGIPLSTSRSISRRSRSADPTSRKLAPPTAAKTVQRRRSKSAYRTPAYNKGSAVNYPPITPKVVPNTPVTLLRQPRRGEMVVSMSGSPVMVPTGYTMQPNAEEMANCNILLQDGTMLSLQPSELRQSHAFIPFALMDARVLHQLKTLKDNLDKVVKLGEKAIK